MGSGCYGSSNIVSDISQMRALGLRETYWMFQVYHEKDLGLPQMSDHHNVASHPPWANSDKGNAATHPTDWKPEY